MEINNGGSMKYFKYLTNITLSSLLLMGTVFGAVAINKGQEAQDNNNNRDCTACEFDYTAYGSECCDSAWEEYGIDCATLESEYSWDCSGCACPGDAPPECGDGNCTGDETYETCPEDCLPPGECED